MHFCTVFKSKLTCDISDFMSHQKPASIILVTKYVTFMLDFRVIYVTHVTYVIIYAGVTYMICYKYDPTYVYKPGVLFMGHRQTMTPQNAASHLGLFCLLRENSLKNGTKIQNHP